VTAKFPQIMSAKGQRALGQTIRRRRANRARAAHHHVVNGASGFVKILRGYDFEFVREQALFNEPDGVPRGIESDGAIMPGASADGDIHMFANQRSTV
jgi:hypothetical protein